MSAVGEENSSLASKCMDFCQALAKQGKTFNFSLSIGSGFSFSLDTRSEDMNLNPAQKCHAETGILGKETKPFGSEPHS